MKAPVYAPSAQKYAWFLMGLAFLGIIINYLDRGALAYAIGPIQSFFHLNNSQFGIIAGAFGIGYLFMTFMGGILVDKYGAHRIWTFFSLAWSLVTIFFGLASGFWAFFSLRFALGLAEGPAFPALSRVVTDWLPQHQRGRALGLSLAAVPFASVIGAPLISSLIAVFNWQIMFLALGTLGITWTLAWYRFFYDSPVDNIHLAIPDKKQIRASQLPRSLPVKPTSWRYLFLNPCLLANNYAFFSFGYLLFFSLTWLPGYFEQTYHLSLKHVGLFLILPWLLGTLGILLGGFLSDYIFQRTHSLRQSRGHIIWVCQLLSATCFIPLLSSPSLFTAILFISLAVGLGLTPNAAFYAINADLAQDKVATSLGIMDSGFALSGMLAPVLTGFLTHFLSNFDSAILLMAGLNLSAALAVFCFLHPDRHIQHPACKLDLSSFKDKGG